MNLRRKKLQSFTETYRSFGSIDTDIDICSSNKLSAKTSKFIIIITYIILLSKIQNLIFIHHDPSFNHIVFVFV